MWGRHKLFCADFLLFDEKKILILLKTQNNAD